MVSKNQKLESPTMPPLSSGGEGAPKGRVRSACEARLKRRVRSALEDRDSPSHVGARFIAPAIENERFQKPKNRKPETHAHFYLQRLLRRNQHPDRPAHHR